MNERTSDRGSVRNRLRMGDLFRRARLFRLAISALALLAGTQTASAQLAVFNPYPPIPPNPNLSLPYAQPALSPYLNLLRGGNPAVNYFLDVAPALQKRDQQLQAEIAPPRLDSEYNQQVQQGLGKQPLQQTGVYTGFGIYQGAYVLPARGYLPYSPPANGRP